MFKLGGTSLSVSVMEVNSGIYRVLSTNTDDNIGGTHFTETLAEYLASEFQRWVLMDLMMFRLKFLFRVCFFVFWFFSYFKLLCFERGHVFCFYFPVHWTFSCLELQCPLRAFARKQAKLRGAVCSDFSLSVRAHQTLNCVNLGLKFEFLIPQELLLRLDKGGYGHWGLTTF